MAISRIKLPDNSYQDVHDSRVPDKADKVSNPTSGNFAGLDSSGNLVDSGKKAADFGSASDVAQLKIECEDINESGTLTQEDGTTYDGTYINGNKWATSSSSTKTALLALVDNTTYTITFGDGIGGYCVVKNSSCVIGESVVYADGYSGMINTAKNDVVTIIGHSGDYLCVRADTTSSGRKFPSSITYVTESQATLFTRCYNEIHPAVEATQPQGGFVPNKLYALGTLTGSVTFALASPEDASIPNHYFWTFETGTTAPTITWPAGISWNGGSAPTINASKHYGISVLNGIGAFMEV